MRVFRLCALVLLLATPSDGLLKNVVVSHNMYLIAVADVINEEFARLGADVQAFSPLMASCAKLLNASSKGCQACLKTVSCGSGSIIDTGGGNEGGGKLKPIDLIHLVNPIDFLKEPLENIISKLGSAGSKFAKNVGKHLVKGLKGIADGFDDTVIDGLKSSLKGLKKLGSHLGKAVKGLTGHLGKLTKAAGRALKGAVKAVGKGFKHVFSGAKKAVKAVGKGVKHVVRGIGRGVKSAAKAVGRGVKKVWRGIKSWFGRRKRSAPTAEEKACMSKCPACRPFISGNEVEAVKLVCGNDIVVKNTTIAAEQALLDEFFNDADTAPTDLLREIQMDSASNLLVKVTALIRGQYRTFSTDVAFNGLDPEAMYKNLAKYIYKNYLGL